MNELIKVLTTLGADEVTGAGSNSGAHTPGTSTSPGGIDDVAGGGDTLVDNITHIVNGIIAVLGIVAVVVIILGGVQYMTSSGDAAKVKKAKDTILYGVIGLIICVLAFAIVNFLILNIISG